MKKNKHTILLVNDHAQYFGIGKYVFNLYYEFLSMRWKDYSIHLLMQNIGRNYSPETLDIDVQHRLSKLRQTGFGKWYSITSYYYYPRKIPDNFSLYHISSQMMGMSVSYVSPAIVTCHDLISYEMKSNHRRLAQFLQRRHLRALEKAVQIIFISEYTKHVFLSLFDYEESKTAVIYHGVSDIFHHRDKLFCREKLGLPLDRPIVLYVGREEPRKNIETLLRTVYKLKKQALDILLVRVGKQGNRSQELVEELSLRKNILYFHDQSEKSLARFYNAADVFVFPSLYEGFGLPVLEALKSGCPVVASQATSIPEITGEAAILHHPLDVDAFAGSVETILNDELVRKEYARKGIEQAKRFNWEVTAQKTKKIYERVLES